MARVTMLVAAIVAGIAVYLPVSQAARALLQGPTITCPSDIQLEATNTTFLGTEVSWEVTASDGIVPICNWLSGALYPIGSVAVTCNATLGEVTSQCLFTITVTSPDTTPPEFPNGCADIPAYTTTDPAGVEVAPFSVPLATDASGIRLQACDKQEGGFLPPGSYPVTCYAFDSWYNVNTCFSFINIEYINVTVVP